MFFVPDVAIVDDSDGAEGLREVLGLFLGGIGAVTVFRGASGHDFMLPTIRSLMMIHHRPEGRCLLIIKDKIRLECRNWRDRNVLDPISTQ